MLKVLVADENLEANLNCCQYLANDKNLDVISSHTGISTLNKYREINPNILVINSDFKDKGYKELINEISSTADERNNSNIILTVEDNAQLNFYGIVKVYQLLYFSEENIQNKIKNSIKQYNLDHYIFYEPNAKNLTALFYKLNIYNEHIGANYLKCGIIQCYNNLELLKNLNDIYTVISQNLNISYNSVRPAMRNALKSANIARDKNGDKGIFKLFENVDSITPKNFIRIITNHYLKQKK